MFARGADLNPARVKAREVWHNWGYFFSMTINSFQAIVPYMGQEKGVLFKGVYLPQISVLSPPIERQYLSVQKHVSSY
jgi:hypothetical protein